jgi:hypothetical protein
LLRVRRELQRFAYRLSACLLPSAISLFRFATGCPCLPFCRMPFPIKVLGVSGCLLVIASFVRVMVAAMRTADNRPTVQ